MRHLFTTLLFTVITLYGYSQTETSRQSLGIQAREDVFQIPHERPAPRMDLLEQTRNEHDRGGTKVKSGYKDKMRQFLVNRATKKFTRALPTAEVKKSQRDDYSLLYIILVVILILLILALLNALGLGPILYLAILVALIILILWLLGVI